MRLSSIKNLFRKEKFSEEKVYLPSIPQINSLQDAKTFLNVLQKYTPKDIEGVLTSELKILDVVKSPSLIEGYFDSLIHQFERSLKQTNDNEQIKEQFVCMIASMFYQLDAQHEIDLLEYDEKAFEQRKALILDSHRYLSDNITRTMTLASDTIKRTFLSTIATAKAAGKTAMVVVDEFGHDVELIFDGGMTNFSMKDVSCTTDQSGAVTLNTTTDDTAKQHMSENAVKRENLIHANRGIIRCNASAYINEWATEVQNIVINSAIFDTQDIAKRGCQKAEEREGVLKKFIDHRQTNKKLAEIQNNFIKTLYRLFYKLDKHSIDLGKSNYISDVIDRYVDEIHQENLKQYVKYVSNVYNEHPNESISKPKDYNTLTEKILSSKPLISITASILTILSPTVISLPIVGYGVAKTLMRK